MCQTSTAVVYLCTDDDPAGLRLCAEWCEARAVAEGLAVAEVVTDADVLLPRAERPGWRRVTELIAAGSVSVVVTLNRRMVADGPKAWRRLAADLDGQGVALLTLRRSAVGERRALVHRVAINATGPDPEARLECLGPAKDVLRGAVKGWGITGEGLDDVLTVAYELVVNAVRHSAPGRIEAVLRLAPDGARVGIEVHDLTRRMPRMPEGAFGDDRGESGRGLLMVDALAAHWGADATEDGKRVWAEVGLSEPVSVPELSRAARRALVLTDVVGVSRMRAVPRLGIS